MWPIIPATPGAKVKRSQCLSQCGERVSLDRLDQNRFEKMGPEFRVNEKVLSSIPSTVGTHKQTAFSPLLPVFFLISSPLFLTYPNATSKMKQRQGGVCTIVFEPYLYWRKYREIAEGQSIVLLT